MKDIVLQTRYPYAAGVITMIWLGSAIICILRNDISLEFAVSLVVVATLLIASVGFTTPKH